MEDILWGIAIGDAFGAGIEFQDRDWIRANVDFTKFINARDRPFEQYHDWEYTDDTEMTLGLIKALISGREFTEDLLVEYWIREYEEDQQIKGYGRAGHGSMRWVYSGEKDITWVRDYQRNKEFPGNAPPMRAVPLGFLPENLIDAYAIINADATHPHPQARAASVLVARAAQYVIVQKGNLQEIILHCSHFILGLDQTTLDLLPQIDLLPPPDELDETGFALLCGKQPLDKFNIKGLGSDAMRTAACVLYILKYAHHTFDGFKNAIYMGGDVDSLASICTGILAGRFGLDTIPAFMKENVEGKEKIPLIAQQFIAYL